MLFDRKFSLPSACAIGLITVCLAHSQNLKTFNCKDATQIYDRAGIKTPHFQTFSPPGSSAAKCMALDLENDGFPEIAFTYSPPNDVDQMASTTFKILKYEGRIRGWKSIFARSDEELGTNDYVKFEPLKGSNGADGVLVLSHFEGSGTATYWSVLAMARNRIVTLDPSPARKRTLEKYGYVDFGDSSVSWKGDLIVWHIVGYSGHTAHCCPDKPSLQMTFRFTGTEIRLESVKQLPPGS